VKAEAAEVRSVLSEDQLWAVSDSAEADISKAGWARARAWQALRDTWGWKNREIAQRAKKSDSLVSFVLKAADNPKFDPDQTPWEEAYEWATNPDSVHFSSDTSEWATPTDIFAALDSEFQFTIDVCATAKNAKCAKYFTKAQDGLSKDWMGSCWMNPPYGDEIGKWVEKAYESGQNGATVVCLVPARVDTDWFWRFCRFGEVRFLKGRLRFGEATASAPFPSAVVIFPGESKVRWWEWRAQG